MTHSDDWPPADPFAEPLEWVPLRPLETFPARLEKFIGVALLPQHKHATRDLYRIHPDVIDNLRQLMGVAGWWDIRHVMEHYYLDSGADWGHIHTFLVEIVLQGRDLATWRNQGFVRRLEPQPISLRLLVTGREEILAPLDPVPGEPHLRVVPDLGDWPSYLGQPAVERAESDYRVDHRTGTCTYFLGLEEPPDLEPIGDLEVAVRRWIAAELVRYPTVDRRSQLNGASPEQLLTFERGGGEKTETFDPNRWGPLSEDALWAVLALHAELCHFRPFPPGKHVKPTAVPGFIGPDEWYRGQLPAEFEATVARVRKRFRPV